jgi:hypothetical protein
MNEFGASPIAGGSGFRNDGLGLWCDAGGAFLGGVPLLIARRQADGSIRFSPRREDEIARLLRSAYGARFDGNTRMGGLRAVANGLNAGQECRAIIAALHMRLPALTPLAKIMAEHAERLIKAEWDESKHRRQPAGIPEGGQFAPAGGSGAAARPRADRGLAEVDMTEGAMAPPPTLSAEERAAAERILRDLEAYAQTSADALGRVPEDVARLIEQFKRDPIGTLRSLGPSLSGINPILSPGSLSAARTLAAARGVGSTAETALPETYAPPEATAKDPVGRRGFPLEPAVKHNVPEIVEGRQ